MWQAMCSTDTANGHSRGYMVISPGDAAVGDCALDHGELAVGPHLCDHTKDKTASPPSQLCWRQAVDQFAAELNTVHVQPMPLQSPWVTLSSRLDNIFGSTGFR